MYFAAVLSIAALFMRATAMHFYLGGNEEPRCFYFDLRKDMMFAATHSAWELEKTSNNWVRDDSLAIEVTIDELFDNNHRVFNQKLAPFGDYQFVSQEGGEHRVCYRALVDGWWAKETIKLEVDFVVGESDIIDTRGNAKVDHLTERIADLNRKLIFFRREQTLMREREAAFRDQSEATNARVARMTILQLVVLAATCAWQISHLRGFFTKQKLV